MVFREKMFGAIAFNFFFKKPEERIKGLCWGSAFIVATSLLTLRVCSLFILGNNSEFEIHLKN